MATSVHRCTFDLETIDLGRYLTGLHVCTQCGAHKSVKVSMQASTLLLWEAHLKKSIAERELRLKQLRSELRNTSSEKKDIAGSLACLAKAVALLMSDLELMEKSSKIIAETNHSLDLHNPSANHSTSNEQVEFSATTLLPEQDKPSPSEAVPTVG